MKTLEYCGIVFNLLVHRDFLPTALDQLTSLTQISPRASFNGEILGQQVFLSRTRIDVMTLSKLLSLSHFLVGVSWS